MKAKLLGLLPGMRWVPHDLPTQDSVSHKTRLRPRNPFSSKAAPHELDVRTSSISLTLEPDSTAQVRTHAQPQSAFFAKLPLEIRKMVYEYVMGERMVHLTLRAKKRLGHFTCEDGEAGRECTCRVLVGGREGDRLSSACVQMLHVCRKMYFEAVPHLYRPHTFSLLHISHLLYLSTRLPQPRLDSIRTLRLRWAIRALPYLRRGPTQRLAYREDTLNWERAWSILASMDGLRDLYVVLVDPSPLNTWERSWIELEEQLLRPVQELVRPRWFELALPFASCRVDWDMAPSRVVLTRPERILLRDDER